MTLDRTRLRADFKSNIGETQFTSTGLRAVAQKHEDSDSRGLRRTIRPAHNRGPGQADPTRTQDGVHVEFDGHKAEHTVFVYGTMSGHSSTGNNLAKF